MDSPASCRISVPGSTQVPDWFAFVFAYRTITLFGRLSHTFLLTSLTVVSGPSTPHSVLCGLGSSPFARHYSGNSFFSSGYLDVSVPQVPSSYLCVQYEVMEVRSIGFPHSDIPGSSPVHGSPRLFAVSHVLLRHLAPRHSP